MDPTAVYTVIIAVFACSITLLCGSSANVVKKRDETIAKLTKYNDELANQLTHHFNGITVGVYIRDRHNIEYAIRQHLGEAGFHVIQLDSEVGQRVLTERAWRGVLMTSPIQVALVGEVEEGGKEGKPTFCTGFYGRDSVSYGGFVGEIKDMDASGLTDTARKTVERMKAVINQTPHLSKIVAETQGLYLEQ